MRSLSLVLSECFLSGRGQGHVNNFYTVVLENFATACRRYTGDIHNSVRSRFVYDTYTTIRDSNASRLGAHVYYTWAHLNPPIS